MTDYNIIEGTRLHLVVKKTSPCSDLATGSVLPQGHVMSQSLSDEMMKFLVKHFSQSDAEKIVSQFKQVWFLHEGLMVELNSLAPPIHHT